MMKDKFFEVTGSKRIKISYSASSVTGQVAGFSFSEEGKAGGVLSRSEAKRLAEFILQRLSECTDTEEEVVSKSYQMLTQ